MVSSVFSVMCSHGSSACITCSLVFSDSFVSKKDFAQYTRNTPIRHPSASFRFHPATSVNCVNALLCQKIFLFMFDFLCICKRGVHIPIAVRIGNALHRPRGRLAEGDSGIDAF